jgi:hypothetical protein
MWQFLQARRDLFLLLSLLLVILLYPLLDHRDVQRIALGGLMFVPLLLATGIQARVQFDLNPVRSGVDHEWTFQILRGPRACVLRRSRR